MLSTQFFLVPFLPKYDFPHFHKLHAIREVNLWTFQVLLTHCVGFDVYVSWGPRTSYCEYWVVLGTVVL